MFWIKSTLYVNIVIQSVLIILAGVIITLPNNDIFVLTDFRKDEIVPFLITIFLAWQFLMALVYFLVPPFAFKNQMLDLTVIIAYSTLGIYLLILTGRSVPDLFTSPVYWILMTLGTIYYFVTILDATDPNTVYYKKDINKQ